WPTSLAERTLGVRMRQEPEAAWLDVQVPRFDRAHDPLLQLLAGEAVRLPHDLFGPRLLRTSAEPGAKMIGDPLAQPDEQDDGGSNRKVRAHERESDQDDEHEARHNHERAGGVVPERERLLDLLDLPVTPVGRRCLDPGHQPTLLGRAGGVDRTRITTLDG